MNGVSSANILKTHLRNTSRKKRLEFWMEWWFPLQDSAWPHIALVTMEVLADIGGSPIEHPPCSLDLASCAFWAFAVLKHELEGQIEH
jgi:hypothetical protein